MERIEHHNTVNLLNPESQNNILSFSVSEKDNSHSVILKLICDGEPYVTAGEATPVWYAKRADGTEVSGMCQLTNMSRVRYDLTSNDTSVVGLTQAEIRLYDMELTNPPLEYDTQKSYAINEVCIYDDRLWRCYVPTSGGAWTGLSDWEPLNAQILITPRIMINVIPAVYKY